MKLLQLLIDKCGLNKGDATSTAGGGIAVIVAIWMIFNPPIVHLQRQVDYLEKQNEILREALIADGVELPPLNENETKITKNEN